MSKLKDQAPVLLFDEAEMLKWGYIWRIGTKVRAKAKDEGDDEEQPDEDAGKHAKLPEEKIPGLTAADAGLPAELLGVVDEKKKYPSAFNKKQGMDFGIVFDRAVGAAIASMLGDVSVVDFVKSKALHKEKLEANRQLVKQARDAALERGEKQPRLADIPLPEVDIGIEWTKNELLPPVSNCVEIGPVRVIGGIRPQNFDVAYRPDGPRIVYDSKSLNDAGSIPKNWQNMVNDLGTEATTVHTRFPGNPPAS